MTFRGLFIIRRGIEEETVFVKGNFGMNNGSSKISKIRLTLAGAVVLVTAFAVGVSGSLYSDELQRGLTSFTDSFENVRISDSETPLADQTVKTTKKSSTKTVKLKKKAKKTYTKRLKDKVSTKTTVKENGSNMVETKTTVKTETKEKYKKRSKKKKVTTTVTTTVITTTYAAKSTETELSSAETEKTGAVNPGQQANVQPAEEQLEQQPATSETPETEGQPDQTAEQPAGEIQPEQSGQIETQPEQQPEAEPEQPKAETEGQPEQPAAETQPEQQPQQSEPEQSADVPSNETAPALPEGVSAIKTAAPKADRVLLDAFDTLGFQFSVDAKYQYTGVFDSKTRQIILRNNDDNVYHELGHFLAFASSNYDVSSAFVEVYKAEKSLYNGRNSSYVLKNSSEYFAESYRNYVLEKDKLKAERPLTYKAVETALSRLTDSQLARLKRVYGSIWN